MAYWPHLYLLLFILVIWRLEKRYPVAMARVEENLMLIVISAIMFVSFGQVIARYAFNTGWHAALEFTTIAFSWLILLGMSYGIKTRLHLGVDIVLNAVPTPFKKLLSLFAAVATFLYGAILLDSTWLTLLNIDVRGGAIEYWSKMYKIGIGSDELRYPEFFREFFDLKPRVHRWLVLLILPLSLALLCYRALQAFIAIYKGERSMLISGHEAEDLLEENKNAVK
ncbi:TRAP transporter small permease subunit [Marinomonas agarivorans]|nr:TRAP transporter small permease subunit [Marinomonas agarivorans]